jgi:hypothetical protein
MAIWILIGAGIGFAASRVRGFSSIAGIVLGAVLGIFALLLFLIRGQNQKKCPHCAEWVKADASICKHCKNAFAITARPSERIKTTEELASDKRVKRATIAVVVAFIALVAIGAFYASTHNLSGQTDLSHIPYPAVSAADLCAAYDANEVSADGRYKNQRLMIDGIVDNVGKDITQAPYVTLGTANAIARVQLLFDKSSGTALSGLSRGSHFSADCVVAGKLMNVIAKNCHISR